MSDDTAAITGLVRDVEGLPRRNGELVFEEPWHTRAFGVAMALTSQHVVDWEEFRGELIERIGDWERSPTGEWSYYERWVDALESVLLARGIVDAAELETRAEAIAEAAAHEHDADHPHEH